jgi:predicted nucleic acid-binding protein
MDIDDTIRSVEQSLDDLTRPLPPEAIIWFKQRFESVVQNLLGLNSVTIKIDFVIDTNTIISSLLRYAKGKESILFRLTNDPIFKFHAPSDLEFEVNKYIQTNEKKFDKNKLIEGWKSLKNVLTIGSPVSINALTLANIIIGDRDPKDARFVAMYIDIGAEKIITYDRDFEHSLLQTLKIDKVGPFVAGVYRGLFSFFLLNDLTPAAVEFFGQLILEFVNVLFDTVKLLLDFFAAVSQNAINEALDLLSNFFPQARSWIESDAVNVALIILAFVTAGAIIINKNIRGNLQQIFSLITRSLQPMIENLITWLTESIKLLVYCGKILLPHTTATLVQLLTNILTVVAHLKTSPFYI